MCFPKRTLCRSTQDNVLFLHRTMCRFQTRPRVASTQDNVSFPNRTMCRVQTGQCVVSKQDNVSCPNTTMCVFQTGQCVFPKQDNVCFPNRTMYAPQTGKSKDGSDFDDFLTKTIGAPSKKIDHAETTAPKRPESISRPGQWRQAELISRPGGVNKPSRPGVN